MSILNAIRSLFSSPPKRQRRHRSDKEIVRGLVAEVSQEHGDLSLRLGNYITQEDVDKIMEKVLAHDFLKGK